MHIIYLYDNNDDFDNNSLRTPFKAYGKGAYIKKPEANTFEPYYFDKTYDDSEAAVVLLDDNCHPSIHEFRLSTKAVLATKVVRWLQGLELHVFNGFVLPAIRRVYRNKDSKSVISARPD